MPPHDPGADREAELAALQTAFDEYIASSRELEDELDAELAKMRTFFNQRFLRNPNAGCLILIVLRSPGALVCWYPAILI